MSFDYAISEAKGAGVYHFAEGGKEQVVNGEHTMESPLYFSTANPFDWSYYLDVFPSEGTPVDEGDMESGGEYDKAIFDYPSPHQVSSATENLHAVHNSYSWSNYWINDLIGEFETSWMKGHEKGSQTIDNGTRLSEPDTFEQALARYLARTPPPVPPDWAAIRWVDASWYLNCPPEPSLCISGGQACRVTFAAICPGDYLLKVWVFIKGTNASSYPPTSELLKFKVTITEEDARRNGTFMVVMPLEDCKSMVPDSLKPIFLSPIPKPGEAGSATCSTPALDSLNLSLALGASQYGENVGFISLHGDELSAGSISLEKIRVDVIEDEEVSIEDLSSDAKLITAPDADVLLLRRPGGGVDLEFYKVGTSLGTLKHKWEVRPIAANDYSQVVVQHTVGGQGELYTFGKSANLWSLDRDGVSEETLQEIDNISTFETVRTLKEPGVGGAEVHKERSVYIQGPNGRLRTQLILAEGTAAQQTTTWSYGAATGYLESVVYPDGNWERHTYHADGRRWVSITPWLDSQFSDQNPDSHKSVETIYSALPSTYTLDGLSVQISTTIERILGQEVARTYEVFWIQPVSIILNGYQARPTSQGWSIRAPAGWQFNATTTAALDANTGLRITKYNRDVVTGEEIRTIHENGTMTLHAKGPSAFGGERIDVRHGAPDPTFSAVVAGEHTISISNASGGIVSEQTWALRPNEESLLLQSKVAFAYTDDDSRRGKPTKFRYLDGTTEEFAYACCGRLLSHKDRDGVTTAYHFNGIGRLLDETRLGVKTTYEYDAANHVILSTRFGSESGSGSVVLSAAKYDLAGRVEWTKSSSDIIKAQRTDYAYSLATSGGLVRTATHSADGASSIQTHYRDGRLFIETGTGVRPEKILYGVTPQGLRWRQVVRLGDGPDESEWTKSYSDAYGELIQVQTPDDYSTHYYYNAKGQLVRQTAQDGVQTLYAYDERGRQVTTALDVADLGTINFDGTDRITRTLSSIAIRGNTPVHRTVTEVWESSGDVPVTIASVDVSADGLHTWSKNRGELTYTKTVYGADGIRTQTTTLPDKTQRVRVYLNGRLKTETRKDAEGLATAETAYGYDAHNRLRIGSTLHAPGSALPAPDSALVTTYAYHADDKLATVRTPDPDLTPVGPGYDAQITAYAYDDSGRVSDVTQPDGTHVFTTYWPTGLVKRTSGSRTYPSEYTYDAQGRVKTLTTWKDFAGLNGEAVTTWNYHAQRGWLMSKRYADNTGPDYTYDGVGRLKTRTWARLRAAGDVRLATVYNYATATGDLTGVDYGDGTHDVSLSAYDRSGRPTTISDAAGTRTLTYQNGRLDDESYSGGLLAGRVITRTPQSGEAANPHGLDRIGTLAATGLADVVYGYDSRSRLQTITQGARVATLGYKPLVGTLQTVTTTDAGVTRLVSTRTTDNLGRVAVISFDNPAPDLLASRTYTYDAANQRTEVVHEDARRWAYGYDALGQVISAEKRQASDPLLLLPGYDYDFVYDDIGNRKSATTNGRVANYASDALNRYLARGTPLFADVRGSAAAAASVLVNDELALRTGDDFYRAVPVRGLKENTLKIQAASASPQQAATENRLVLVPAVPESFSFDADGNLLQDGLWNYTWDAENRLIALELRSDVVTATWRRLEFAYDHQGRRVQKIVKTGPSPLDWTASDTRFLYDSWNLIAEYNALSSFAVVRGHVWGLDLSGSAQGAGGVGGLLWTTVASTAKTYAAAADANGNVIAYVDVADGSVAGRRDYGPFGEGVLATGVAGSLPFGFSTKYLDVETGLHYYGFRYYNPSTGRWLSRDPLQEQGGVNLYATLGNNLLTKVDYLGLANTVMTQLAAAIARGDIAEVRALLAIGESALGQAEAALAREYLSNVAKCEAAWAAYKLLKCKGCNSCGSSEATVNATCLAAEVAGRGLYLKMKCDYILPGSIVRGSAIAEAGHQTQLAGKTVALAKCTARALLP